jgi:hypothetical protein
VDWQQLARRIGVSPQEIASQYHSWQKVQRSVDTRRRVRERTQLLERQRAATFDALAPIEALFGRPADADALGSWREILDTAVKLEPELQAADLFSREAQRKADESAAQAQLREQELRGQLTALGWAGGSTAELRELLETLPVRAEAAHAARERALELSRIHERAQRSPALPELELRAQELKVELEDCERRLRRRAVRGEQFSVDEHALVQAVASDAFDRGWTELNAAEQKARNADEAERQEAQQFLLRYEREAPALRERLEQHGRALERARSFRDAIELARTTLEQVARETHRDWSGALNAELGRVLQGLGSEVADAMVDEKLRLRLTRSGRLLSAEELTAQLSAGAVERIYLALRIALSRALAQGGRHLPLILDDPFANADDARFVLGLDWLLDAIAPTQQVLLLACQDSRYAWARHRLAGAEGLVPLSLRPLAKSSREASAP